MGSKMEMEKISKNWTQQALLKNANKMNSCLAPFERKKL